ncbi:hypothetical protein Hanom_Chr09g00761811 [Helianthus anomalus]
MSNTNDVIVVEESGGGVPLLKWEEGLFEKVVWGHQFADEWDTRYLAQGQTSADATLGYITFLLLLWGT